MADNMTGMAQCGMNEYKKKEHNQHSSVFKVLRQLLFYLNVTSIYNSSDFCLVVKRLVITKNSVVKIQNLVVNHGPLIRTLI